MIQFFVSTVKFFLQQISVGNSTLPKALEGFEIPVYSWSLSLFSGFPGQEISSLLQAIGEWGAKAGKKERGGTTSLFSSARARFFAPLAKPGTSYDTFFICSGSLPTLEIPLTVFCTRLTFTFRWPHR